MTPGASATYWRAVEALREAESLAQLTSSVSGPADEPPKQESDEPGWIADWTERAGKVLERARQWADSKERAISDRAKRMAKRIWDGSNEVLKRIKVGSVKVAKATYDDLKSVSDAAQKLQLAWGLGTVLATTLVAFVAYRLYVAKGSRA